MWRKGKTTTHLTPSQSQRKYVVSSWNLAYVVTSVWQTWFVQSIDSHPYFQTKKFHSRFLDLAGLSPMKAISVGLERVCLLIWGEVEGADHPQKLDSLSNTNPLLESRFSLLNFWKQKQWKWKCTLGNVIPSSGLCYSTWKCFCESPFHSTPLEEVERKFIDFILCVLRKEWESESQIIRKAEKENIKFEYFSEQSFHPMPLFHWKRWRENL